MFGFIYTYRLRTTLKNRALLFWSLVFPILLGCFFYAAFRNMGTSEDFETIHIGFVSPSSETDLTTNFQKQLSMAENNGARMFKVTTYSQEAAAEALNNNTIAGYYSLKEDKLQLTLAKEGLRQSMLTLFLNQYLQISAEVMQIASIDPSLLNQNLMEKITTSQDFINYENHKEQSKGVMNFYFFTLMGMACMFGLSFGIHNNQESQANQTPQGIRTCLSPIPKIKIVLAQLLAAFTVLMIELCLLLVLFQVFFKINFGSHLGLILLICAIASITSISMGGLLSQLFKNFGTDQQMSIGVSIQMFLSFFAGMMGSTQLKFMIDQHVPILGYLNPVNLISDSFYRLYYYGDIAKIVPNLICLSLFALVFLAINISLERSNQYASL